MAAKAGLPANGGNVDGEAPDAKRQKVGGEAPAAGGTDVKMDEDSESEEEVLPNWEEVCARIQSRVRLQPCEEWFKKVVSEVHDRLTTYLKDLSAKSAAGDFTFNGTLEEQEPLSIEDGGKMTTVKESWNWDHAESSLSEKGMYEGPGSIFWLKKTNPTWEGQPLAATGLTYPQVKVGRTVWSNEVYKRSAEAEEKRRYIGGPVIPTAIQSMSDFPAGAGGKKKQIFIELPILASRAIVAGWYTMMHDALMKPAFGGQVEQLYEAALSMPMRVRVGCTRQQATIDSMSFAEAVFATANCCCDSFWDFSQKAVDVIGARVMASMTQSSIVTKCEKLFFSFHGSKIQPMGARNLQSLCPFVDSAAVGAAIKSFEEISPALNEQSKLGTLMASASKTYQKGTPAAAGAVAALIDWLKASLVFKDISREGHMTTEFLVGTSKKPGVAQVFYKRAAFIDLVKVLASSTQGPVSEEAKERIFPRLAKFENFAMAAVRTGQAAAGAESAEKLADEVSDEESGAETGVANAAAKKVDTFVKELSKSGKLLALLLAKTHGGGLRQ